VAEGVLLGRSMLKDFLKCSTHQNSIVVFVQFLKKLKEVKEVVDAIFSVSRHPAYIMNSTWSKHKPQTLKIWTLLPLTLKGSLMYKEIDTPRPKDKLNEIR
jgi:hypothetical protein